MLNLSVGSQKYVGEKSCILTEKGMSGHAVFGPYERRDEGLFDVRFDIALVDGQGCDDDHVCAVVDIATETGNLVIASRGLTLSDVRDGPPVINLNFRIGGPQILEYRVFCDGSASLLISEEVQVTELGGGPGRYIADHFKDLPENHLYEAMFGGSAALRNRPGHIGIPSSVCRQLHFSLDEFRFWAAAMGRKPRLHRKDWEFFFIAQSLYEAGMLQPSKYGLGFAVGREPLPALFASFGCDILATDQAMEQAIASGWATSGQYLAQRDQLFHCTICDRSSFDRHVKFKNLDMNAISDEHFGVYDFCWSSCALEHLGSLEHGLVFIENSMKTLKPGGIAVHTTEFNLSSNDETIESEGVSIYRKQDIELLIERLTASGHKVVPFDWSLGKGFAELVVDLPPYRQSPHLRLKTQEFDTSSIGIIIHKAS
jgi:hypothetical protein